MSQISLSPSRHSTLVHLPITIPRVSLFQTENSSLEYNIEEPTLHSSKETKFNCGFSTKKSRFSLKQPNQENQEPEESPSRDGNKHESERPAHCETFSHAYEVGSNYCSEGSPSSRGSGPLKRIVKKTFNDDLYRRAEEYLDSQQLVIVVPDEQRRRTFNNLRVSSAKVLSRQDREPSHDSVASSGDESPRLISTNITTSSLLQRRSSLNNVCCGQNSHKIMLTKSPFCKVVRKGDDIVELDKRSVKEPANGPEKEVLMGERCSPRKRPLALTSLNTKLQGTGPEEGQESIEVSGAQYSPIKVMS